MGFWIRTAAAQKYTTERETLTGGAAGATGGAILGAMTGKAGLGAAIGGPWVRFSAVTNFWQNGRWYSIVDQANKLIRHFYGLGAHLSTSNFPGAAVRLCQACSWIAVIGLRTKGDQTMKRTFLSCGAIAAAVLCGSSFAQDVRRHPRGLQGSTLPHGRTRRADDLQPCTRAAAPGTTPGIIVVTGVVVRRGQPSYGPDISSEH